MKKIITFCILVVLSFVTKGQSEFNPFESIGKEGKMLTLSNGKYIEVEMYDSLQQIGSAIINRNTGEIHELLPIDDTSEFKYDPTTFSRWYSLDPMAAKYSDHSPYVAYANNPILFIDSGGDSIRLHGTKDTQWETLAYLQTLTNDKLILKNGIVTIEVMGGANPEKNLSIGTELVRELVEHKRNVHIVQNNINIKRAGIFKDENSFNVVEYENAHNGVGLDAIVHIDFTKENETTLLIENIKTNKNVLKKTAREGSLAHELIHAYYYMIGESVPYGSKNDPAETYTYKDENGKTTKTRWYKEETDTVGLTGERKYTENKIRKEQGWGKRAKY